MDYRGWQRDGSRLALLRPRLRPARLPQVLPQLRGSPWRRRRDAGPGCATRAARSFPANSVSSLARTATRDAPLVLPRAARSCAQALEPPKPRYSGPGPRPPARPTASSATPTLHPTPTSTPRDASDLTSWEHSGAGWSKSLGEARPRPGGRRSRRKSRSDGPGGDPGNTRGRRRGAPMVPALRGRLAPGLGAQRGRAPRIPSAESRVVLPRLLPASSPARGGPRRGEGSAGTVLPPVPPRRASQVRPPPGLRLALLPAFLPNSSPAPPGSSLRSSLDPPRGSPAPPAPALQLVRLLYSISALRQAVKLFYYLPLALASGLTLLLRQRKFFFSVPSLRIRTSSLYCFPGFSSPFSRPGPLRAPTAPGSQRRWGALGLRFTQRCAEPALWPETRSKSAESPQTGSFLHPETVVVHIPFPDNPERLCWSRTTPTQIPPTVNGSPGLRRWIFFWSKAVALCLLLADPWRPPEPPLATGHSCFRPRAPWSPNLLLVYLRILEYYPSSHTFFNITPEIFHPM